MAQERDVKEGGRNQKQEGTSENKDSKEGRECEGSGNDSVASEVLGEVEPFALVILLRQIDSVQGQSVDRLTGSVRQKHTFPTLEGKENEEGDAVTTFGRLSNMIKEAEVIV